MKPEYNLELPTLFTKGVDGAVRSWRTWTVGPVIFQESGQVNGKKILSRRIAEAKNIGRSNVTSPDQQAALEARSDWKKKLDRKYVKSQEEVHDFRIRPLLAPNEDFHITKKYVKYPADVQPKLDGNRCLAYWERGEIVLLSRGLQRWHIAHLEEALKLALPNGAMFDGELYVHGVSRQTIGSWIKKYHSGKTEQIQFYVYDIPIIDGDQKLWREAEAEGRRFDLDRLVPEENAIIKRVPTFQARSEEEIIALCEAFIKQGFEGGMVRNWEGAYRWGSRSKDLLKFKKFKDAEFRITGWEIGKGKDEKAVKWVCETDDGKTFTCVQNTTYDEREQLLAEADTHIGSWLTVKYQGLSDDGIPQFVRGLGIRSSEDMDEA